MPKFCPECGSLRMENAKFCVTCGYAFESAAQTSSSNTNSSETPRNTTEGNLSGTAGNPSGTVGTPSDTVGTLSDTVGTTSDMAGAMFQNGLMGMGGGFPLNSFMGMAMLKDPSKIQVQYPGNGRFFRYNETGSALYSGRTYQAWEEDETVKVLVRISCKEEDAPVFETDRSFMDNLENLLKIFPLEEWNGFSASMSGVMDGSHTGFTYLDREGHKTSFSNYAAVPAGFRSAYLMFSDLFEDLYYEHFPNPERTFGNYLDRQAANAGGTLSTGRYYALFAKGAEENEMSIFQNGRIGSRILKFPKRFGVPNPGAVAACILRESSDSDPERYLYKVALSYHTSNEKGEGTCVLEIIPEEDLFSADSVTASAFTHDTLEKHYFGYFADKEYDEGEIERTCKLVVYECTNHVLRPCGEAFVQIPRDKTGFGSESISDLIALAEACDLKKTAKDMTDRPDKPALSIFEKNGFTNIEALSENRTDAGVMVKISSYA